MDILKGRAVENEGLLVQAQPNPQEDHQRNSLQTQIVSPFPESLPSSHSIPARSIKMPQFSIRVIIYCDMIQSFILQDEVFLAIISRRKLKYLLV